MQLIFAENFAELDEFGLDILLFGFDSAFRCDRAVINYSDLVARGPSEQRNAPGVASLFGDRCIREIFVKL